MTSSNPTASQGSCPLEFGRDAHGDIPARLSEVRASTAKTLVKRQPAHSHRAPTALGPGPGQAASENVEYVRLMLRLCGLGSPMQSTRYFKRAEVARKKRFVCTVHRQLTRVTPRRSCRRDWAVRPLSVQHRKPSRHEFSQLSKRQADALLPLAIVAPLGRRLNHLRVFFAA